MYAAPSPKQGMSYRPYISDGESYKQHFSVRQGYDCHPFRIIGPISNLASSNQGGKGEAPVKIISPTEGAVERAEEDKKREDKEERKRKILHSIVGSGARKTSKAPLKKKGGSKVKRVRVKPKSNRRKVTKSRQPSHTRRGGVSKKTQVKKRRPAKPKSILKRRK